MASSVPSTAADNPTAVESPKPHVSRNSGDNEWYTPPEIIEAARAVMGHIDVDPASNPEAQKVVKAGRFYTKEQNGLEQTWAGCVWLNPPYARGLIGKFIDKLLESKSVSSFVALTNNATDTGWAQKLKAKATAVCFPDGRIRFWKPDGEPGKPLQGQMICYYGRNKEKFVSTFGKFGKVMTPETVTQPAQWRDLFTTPSQMDDNGVNFLIDGFLAEGITFIGAPPGGFKTWMALAMCKSLIMGTPFLGKFKVERPVPVVYMVPECGESAFRSRLTTIQMPDRSEWTRYGQAWDFIFQGRGEWKKWEQIHVRTLNNGPALNLTDPRLLAMVSELKPAVFLDSSIRFNPTTDENSSAQNRQFTDGMFNLLRAGARGVVPLHHSTKAFDQNEMTLENVLRGTGDLSASADSVIGLRTVDRKNVLVLVKNLKPRDFDFAPFQVQARPYLDLSGELRLVEDASPSTKQAEAERKAEQQTHDADELVRAIETDCNASYRKLSAQVGIPIKRIKDVAFERGLVKEGDTWVRKAGNSVSEQCSQSVTDCS